MCKLLPLPVQVTQFIANSSRDSIGISPLGFDLLGHFDLGSHNAFATLNSLVPSAHNRLKWSCFASREILSWVAPAGGCKPHTLGRGKADLKTLKIVTANAAFVLRMFSWS
jgi:hypothetical protein